MTKGKTLVILQFLCIAYIFLISGIVSRFYFGLVIQGLALFVGLGAIYNMELKNVKINPEPKENIKLKTTGLYRYFRHPMYAGILLFLFPVIIYPIYFTSLAAYIFLINVLIIKMNYEEMLLRLKFPEYREYEQKTKRLIPYLY